MFEARVLQSVRATAVRSEPRRLLARTAVLIGARVGGSALTLGYTVLLARVTTPAELGLAMSAMAAAFLVSVVASLNVESGSIRFLVRYLAQGDTARAAGFVAVCRRVVAAAAVLALAGGLAGWGFGGPGFDPAVHALALLTAPVLAITRVYARHAGALDAVLSGALPRMLVRPALFVLVLGALHLGAVMVAASVVICLHLAAAVLVLLLQVRLLRARLAFAARGPRDTGEWRRWLVTGIMLSPMLVMNEYMNYILLGSAAFGLPAATVAQLGIALSLQNFLGFSLAAVDMSFAPKVARAIAARERERCRRLLSVASGLKCAAVAGGGCLVLVVKEPLLGLFGPHYLAAGDAFLILLAIPASAAVFGPSALVLNVLGRRRELLGGSLAGLAGIAVATPVGGWLGGLDGAALGAAGAFAFSQALLYLLCRGRTGIDASVFAALVHGFGRRDRR
jgi:O-antigen/teichoic acid export membrane protein